MSTAPPTPPPSSLRPPQPIADAINGRIELGSAIKVTLMFALVLLVTRGATHYLGDRGLYLAAALGGTTDVDAVTVSTAKLHGPQVSALVATTAIYIGIAVNTLVKTGLAAGIGGAPLGKRIGPVGAVTVIAGGVALAIAAGLA